MFGFRNFLLLQFEYFINSLLLLLLLLGLRSFSIKVHIVLLLHLEHLRFGDRMGLDHRLYWSLDCRFLRTKRNGLALGCKRLLFLCLGPLGLIIVCKLGADIGDISYVGSAIDASSSLVLFHKSQVRTRTRSYLLV